MKIKTAELIRPALDWAVSTALQHKPEKDFHSHGMTWNGWWETAAYIDTKPNEYRRVPRYSIDWSQGGPIIEREGITIRRRGPWVNPVQAAVWVGELSYPPSLTPRNALQKDVYKSGPTPLIAAMRCYVASKLGDEVEVPDELM